MRRFEIWAPRARNLALKLGEFVLQMKGPDATGEWALEVDCAETGTDYGYFLDAGPICYPDPRSLWQPQGVHGLSRIYDQSAFNWKDEIFQAPPLANSVIYEIHIGTFTERGTLDEAIHKLDYLVELGVTHVELMPVASFPGVHGWGYDGASLYAVHEPYGGPDALKRFVNAAHCKGLSVLLDVVYNHFGPVGNYTEKFGYYLNPDHQTPWGSAVNLENAGADQVRRFFCDNALMWMRDFHIDGLRIDAVHAFVDRSAIHFLEQLASEVDALSGLLGRRLVLIAESDLNDPRLVTPREAGGLGMDAQWSDDFHHALFTVLCPHGRGGYYSDFGSFGQLAKALERSFVYDGIYSRHRGRMHGRPAESLSPHRFLGFIQNHDQVGNRAIGDRVREIAGFARAKIAAAIVLTSPFIPMLFQGEEWAASSPFQYFADHADPEMARLVSEGRKEEFSAFGWDAQLLPDPEDPETFLRSKLNWDELTGQEHIEMLEWYRKLIRLRQVSPSLNDGEPGHTQVFYNEKQMWLRVVRAGLTVNCNLGMSAHSFAVPEGSRLVLCSRESLAFSGSELVLPPDSVAIVAL